MLRLQRLLIVQAHHNLNRLRLLQAMLPMLGLTSAIGYAASRWLV